jgi:hypothetical protein
LDGVVVRRQRLRISSLGKLAADANSTDGEGDAGGAVPPDALACFGRLVSVCFTVVPTAPLTLPADSVLIDTGTSPMCDQNNNLKSSYCVLAGTSFTLAATQSIRGVGAKPLVVLSTTTIDLQGSIDVSGNMSAKDSTGAGANSSMCTDGTPALGSRAASAAASVGSGATAT